jgi:predicted amidophosphoribosyltransferase
MKCPSCGAAVEEGADLCLECGEPMGDSPAAKLARQENVIRPPATTFVAPKPPGTPPPKAPGPPPPAPTLPGKPAAKKKWATEEPEPLRCPGCGLKTLAARCPSCGNRVRPDDD